MLTENIIGSNKIKQYYQHTYLDDAHCNGNNFGCIHYKRFTAIHMLTLLKIFQIDLEIK